MEIEGACCHVVAMPYPGRGHINPMMNLCKLLSSKRPDIHVTFVVTEEWLGLLEAVAKPTNVHYATIPNVIPSEVGRAKDFVGFLQAVRSNMEAPFEDLLDRLPLPPDVIVFDTYLEWVTGVGRRRGVPVASFWTQSATVLSLFYHFELVKEHRHFPLHVSEIGEEVVDYIPGVPPIRLADFPTIFYGTGPQCLPRATGPVSLVPKAQYLLLTGAYHLEPSVIDALQSDISSPVYPIGPAIPYMELNDEGNGDGNLPDYMEWLNSQPQGSVLYISMGSFLSVSSSQLDEIVAGVRDSSVRFLWVSRGETDLFKGVPEGFGLVVPWCNQLRVLAHPSIGGFWTHCGWNSTLEAVYAGVPMLTSPIFWDQVPNSKAIVKDWKVGWRVRAGSEGGTVTREEIAKLVGSFMDQGSSEVQEMRERATKLKQVCQTAVSKGGSSNANIDSFISDIYGQKRSHTSSDSGVVHL